jgi:hypothetical protein
MSNTSHPASPASHAEPSAELPALPSTPTGRYRHHKGGLYEVIGVAWHSESLEAMVVYRPLQGAGGLWVRPHAMFFGRVTVDGFEVARFERLDGLPHDGLVG